MDRAHNKNSLYAVIGLLMLSARGFALTAPPICHPLLWPATTTVVNPSLLAPEDLIANLQHVSKNIRNRRAHPVSTLSSAGKIKLDDPGLVASREAFKDAENSAVLALTYRLTHNKSYFNKTKKTLLEWARVNQPTGNPIDETKLEGMIWAYDLISCDLSYPDKQQILRWFDRIRQKKIAWTFGNQTRINNHRIHQIKMLLLLDKVLQLNQDWLRDLNNAEHYATLNLNSQSGLSVDYTQRRSLYYHNYVLQPWLEISLISSCCHNPTQQAFIFLSDKILTHHIGGEFLYSQANIDKLRAKNGFTYAQLGGQFDVTKAASTIVTYYTLNQDKPDPRLWSLVEKSKRTPWLSFIMARRLLWQP